MVEGRLINPRINLSRIARQRSQILTSAFTFDSFSRQTVTCTELGGALQLATNFPKFLLYFKSSILICNKVSITT